MWAQWVPLGVLGSSLDRPWGVLGAVLGCLGAVLGGLGVVFGRSWAILGCLGAVLGWSWGGLGRCCRPAKMLQKTMLFLGENVISPSDARKSGTILVVLAETSVFPRENGSWRDVRGREKEIRSTWNTHQA